MTSTSPTRNGSPSVGGSVWSGKSGDCGVEGEGASVISTSLTSPGSSLHSTSVRDSLWDGNTEVMGWGYT